MEVLQIQKLTHHSVKQDKELTSNNPQSTSRTNTPILQLYTLQQRLQQVKAMKNVVLKI